MRWFDGHLDLTYIALHGRDLTRDAASCGGALQPATVTFPTLRQAGVTHVFSTLFIRRKTDAVTGDYAFETADQAFAAAMRQVDMHRAWERAGLITLSHTDSATAEQSEKRKAKSENQPLSVSLAIEGAACIRDLDDAAAFHAAGVRMVSLAWAEGSRWAGGDQSGGGISPDGRQLIGRLDELDIVHDVSHLSEEAFWSLLDAAGGPVVASHSNCRALLPGAKTPQRHLSDEQIRALAARPHSKIGINLFSRFLIPPDELARRPATIQDVLAHIQHIEQLTGRRDLTALGSDMDSGFGAEMLPADLQGPFHLPRLAEGLAAAGWSDAELAEFAEGWTGLGGEGIESLNY